MPITISVVVPVYNDAEHLRRCLECIRVSHHAPLEIIVVDDGSTDGVEQVAASLGGKLLPTGGRRGPAFARNIGARAASGDILLFLDSDVCVRVETLGKIAAAFESDPELDALIGSYDTEPGSPEFLSQYRNLMHCFVHQTGACRASTFWSGCGAIRKPVFLASQGFSENFERPAIEDIELGYRLLRARRKILLDRTLQVTHMKRWTFWNLLKTDIMDRGIPWTELILRDGFMPNDLNVQLSQRVSVALVFLLIALSGFTAVLSGGYSLVPLFTILLLMLARWWSEFGAMDRPRYAPYAVTAMAFLLAVLSYWCGMSCLVPPLLLSPSLLLIQHRYATKGSKPILVRGLTLLYSCGSIVLAAFYLPQTGGVLVAFLILAAIGLLNSQFYIFLAGKRGIPFMLAAIPFHLLYHFYNGLSFTAGLVRHARYTWASTSAGERKFLQKDRPLGCNFGDAALS